MATRKRSTPASAPAPSKAHAFLVASTWLMVGMVVYGVGIDARAVTWPAASGTASAIGQFVDNLHGDDADDQAPVAAAAAVTR